MEDIEDMVGELHNAPAGLHLPAFRNSAVSIKPRRRISANLGAIKDDLRNVSTALDVSGKLDSIRASIPGTQVC